MTAHTNHSAFTLIELLVVVTIIAVLLALLTPAMDRAISQAELAACAAQMRGAASGATAYAMGSRKRYPYRAAADSRDTGYFEPRTLNIPFNVHQTRSMAGFDDRVAMRDYININALQCPPAGDVDLNGARNNSYVSASMAMWFGFKYWGRTDDKIGPGLLKLGDRIGWEGERYSTILGDTCYTLTGLGPATMYQAHPDSLGALTLITQQEQPFSDGDKAGRADQDGTHTGSYWWGPLPLGQGKADLNFASSDGAVQRYLNVRNDVASDPVKSPDMAAVPGYSNTNSGIAEGSWMVIPRR